MFYFRSDVVQTHQCVFFQWSLMLYVFLLFPVTLNNINTTKVGITTLQLIVISEMSCPYQTRYNIIIIK